MNPFGSSPLVGMVCWWPFDIADIPDGWVLCDGENGSIDMRGLLAIGAPDGEDSGACVGSDSHDHEMDILSRGNNRIHTHSAPAILGVPQNNSSDVASIGGSRKAFNFHTHELYGNTRRNSVRHKHSLIDDTESEDSKQLSREQIFIMKT